MDPTQLAMQAVVLLAPYLTEAGKAAAKKAGEATFNRVGAMVSTIRQKFGSDKDTYAQQTLARLEQQPESQARQQTLAEVLSEKITSDPAFAQELQRLVENARQEPATTQFLTQVYGNAKVDEIFNIESVQTLNIGKPNTD